MQHNGVRDGSYSNTGAKTYTYDANGNMTSGVGRVITWNAANLPVSITQGADSNTFLYAPSGIRYKQIKQITGLTTTISLLGTLYEEFQSGSVIDKRHHIFAGGERVAVYSSKTSGQTSLKYFHTDHLGSTDTLTDTAGLVIERFSYDPHGLRRNVDWTRATGGLTIINTSWGFTGHQHLEQILIHMNGRIYDPVLGRFLSADPYIQGRAIGDRPRFSARLLPSSRSKRSRPATKQSQSSPGVRSCITTSLLYCSQGLQARGSDLYLIADCL